MIREPSRDECIANDWPFCDVHDVPLVHGNRPCFRFHRCDEDGHVLPLVPATPEATT